MKVPLSNDIDEKIFEAFNDSSNKLPGKKYEHIEAALGLFVYLHFKLQMALLDKSSKNLFKTLSEELVNIEIGDYLRSLSPEQKKLVIAQAKEVTKKVSQKK